MALLDKFEAARRTRDMLSALPLNPTDVVIERVLSATEAVIQGQPKIMAGTNNYLGLTFDPQCIAAGQTALAAGGTGTTGSRMANGTYQEHLALEADVEHPGALGIEPGQTGEEQRHREADRGTGDLGEEIKPFHGAGILNPKPFPLPSSRRKPGSIE